jgi:ABC-type branched-subunit amino acid transport system permease subunit
MNAKQRLAFSLSLLVAAIIGTGTYAMAFILRIATGGYPPPWLWFALCTAAGAAGAIGAWSGHRRATHE